MQYNDVTTNPRWRTAAVLKTIFSYISAFYIVRLTRIWREKAESQCKQKWSKQLQISFRYDALHTMFMRCVKNSRMAMNWKRKHIIIIFLNSFMLYFEYDFT